MPISTLIPMANYEFPPERSSGRLPEHFYLDHGRRRATPGYSEYATDAINDLAPTPLDAASYIPGVDTYADPAIAYRDWRKGDYLGASAGVLATVLPVGAGVVKSTGKRILNRYFGDLDPTPKLKSREILIPEMPIDEFLTLADTLPSPDVDKVKTVQGVLDRGEQFQDIPFLQADNYGTYATITGHEGRHRAMALRDLGETTMPVYLKVGPSSEAQGIRWTEQTKPGSFDYVETWPEWLKGENGDISPFPIMREDLTSWGEPEVSNIVRDRISSYRARQVQAQKEKAKLKRAALEKDIKDILRELEAR